MWNVMSDLVRTLAQARRLGCVVGGRNPDGDPLLVAQCRSEGEALRLRDSELADGAGLAYVEWESDAPWEH